jgi:glycosyltransferase involved in cell wall biosynthesis
MSGPANPSNQRQKRLRVAWISDYPIEWLPHLPASLQGLKRQHPATWAQVLLGEFQRLGDVEVHVIAMRSRIKGSVTFNADGVSYHVLRASRVARLASVFWADALLIRSLLRRIKPDLVHAWGTERAAALVASRLGRPYLVTMQGLLNWVVQVIPSAHVYLKFMARLEPVALRRARVATCESRFAVDYLSRRYPNLKIRQAEHAPGPDFFRIRRTRPADGTRILAVGTLGMGKGTDLLLQALDCLKAGHDFTVTLVGSGSPDFIEQLRTRTSPELWNRIVMKEHLTPAEVAAELSRATLLAHPTRVDNSPNSVKEAAVAGVPVVASEVGGIPDYITHGKNGLLFPAGDHEALTRSLREALAHPLFSQGRVDQQTWDTVRDYLSPARMAQNFLEAYQLVLQTWPQSKPT